MAARPRSGREGLIYSGPDAIIISRMRPPRKYNSRGTGRPDGERKGSLRMKRTICLLAALAVLAVSAGAAATAENTESEAEGVVFHDGWDTRDNHLVFYEIFVGSFSDSDGDGTGDLRGIINRMDYLNDGDPASGRSLGVEGIWLTPVFLSPSYHKYDVSDYYTIDPAFGTMDDLKELTGLCHARGVKLILDLPLNHTGADHPWYARFLEAHRRGRTTDRYYNYYRWAPAGEPLPPAGRFMEAADGLMVEANFSDRMPELNFDNPLVRKAVLDIGKYYLELGVDGFRFVAAKYPYYGDHERNAAFWGWYTGELKKIRPDVYTVAEVWDTDEVILRYAGSVDCFRFSAAQAEGLIANTARGGNVNRFTGDTERYTAAAAAARPDAQNILFIANHDTDRAAGYLTAASGRMAMAANLYLLSPGSPFIYYGEEIGLRGSRGAAETDANRRLRMRWGDGDTVRDPEGSDYANQTEATAADMLRDPDSLLNHYKKLLMIRKANPEIARGTYRALSFPDSKAGGFLSTWRGNTVAVLHNTGKRKVTLDVAGAAGMPFEQIEAVAGAGGATLENGVLTLDAQTSAVLR